jgi:hypothetical protein
MAQQKIKELEGSKAILYMLFSIEAKLRVHTDLLIEMAEIITQKDPGAIRMETALKTLQELKAVREKFVEDDELLNTINNINL